MNNSHKKYFSSILEDNGDYSIRKWIGLILIIKLSLFIFYGFCFHLYPEVSVQHGFLYVIGGDTFTYYPPLISFVNGDGYGSPCRMPGLAFPFLPLYFITKSQELSYNLVIVFQFILSTISVYVLGLIANLLFNNNYRTFLITILLYSFWYHIGDHYLMADSIANSTLIYAVYFFLVALNQDFKDRMTLFFSGLLLTWSIFSRLIVLVVMVILCCIILYHIVFKLREVKNFFIAIVLFMSSFAICESLWIIRNEQTLNRLVLFTEPEECYSSFSYNWRELNKIFTAWGMESTHWAGEIDWFLDRTTTAEEFPYSLSVLTKNYNADSLTKLKNEYWSLRDKAPFTKNESFKFKVNNYIREYKSKNAVKYYIVNPIKLTTKFFYKKTIVDMPFPALQNMNVLHKIFKTINWLFILVISLLFMLSPLVLFRVRSLAIITFLLIPFSMALFLVYYGAIEQRYFWALVPFCVVFFAHVINYVYLKIKPQ